MLDGSASPTNHPTQITAEKILELIRSLPDAYRETLILRLVEGMTGPEIAARTGLTPGSVRVNLYRGMQRLREKMRQKIERAASELQARTAAGESLMARLKRAMGKRNAR